MKSSSLKQTRLYAKKIIQELGDTKFILLNGQMGAGKTTLVKFLAEFLGEKELVASPTFNVMKVYEKFVHVDAYKISGTLEEYEDYFEDKIVIIEWSDNLKETFENALRINVSMEGNIHIYKKEQIWN